MRTHVNVVLPDCLDEVWPKASPLIDAALQHSAGELDASQVRLLIALGAAHLFVALREGVVVGAAAVEFKQYPNYRARNVIALGGDGLWLEKEQFDRLKRWAKSNGATHIEALCRDSVVRYLRKVGMRPQYTMVRTET